MGILDYGRDLVRDVPIVGKLFGQESSGERGARDAANIQAQYGRDALDLQREIYEQGRQDMMPWLDAGRRSLNTLEGMMGSGEFEMAPEEYGDFNFSVSDYEESPYAKFLQQEGQRGIERSAAARGGLASGNTLAGLQKRAMGISAGDYANQYARKKGEYDTGYRNFLDSYGRRAGQKADKYNRLANMAGMGQTQSSTLGQMGGQYGRDAGAGLTGIGNVMGAGRIGQANARTNMMNQLMNLGGQMYSGAMSGAMRGR